MEVEAAPAVRDKKRFEVKKVSPTRTMEHFHRVTYSGSLLLRLSILSALENNKCTHISYFLSSSAFGDVWNGSVMF